MGKLYYRVFPFFFYKTFNEQETPAGNSVFNKKSKIFADVVVISIKRLYKRISKCSLESLSTCGERNTQKRFILIGSATVPVT